MAAIEKVIHRKSKYSPCQSRVEVQENTQKNPQQANPSPPNKKTQKTHQTNQGIFVNEAGIAGLCLSDQVDLKC